MKFIENGFKIDRSSSPAESAVIRLVCLSEKFNCYVQSARYLPISVCSLIVFVSPARNGFLVGMLGGMSDELRAELTSRRAPNW